SAVSPTYAKTDRRDLHSFPTRRSSDLTRVVASAAAGWLISWRTCSALTGAGPLANRQLSSAPSIAAPSVLPRLRANRFDAVATRSEEHTSELQSRSDLVCRLLLEKKKR